MRSGRTTASVGPMLGTPPLGSPFSGLVTRLREWPLAAQQQARRNAMIASTACTQRRAEREDVEDFLRDRSAPAPVADRQTASHQASHPETARTAHG